jgi:hypothetical protein
MDVVVVTPIGHEHYVDVAVANPGAPSYVYGLVADRFIERKLGSGFVKGSAADQRGAQKYSRALTCLSAAQLAGFTAFSIEISGVLGNSADAFLKSMQLSHAARVGEGAPEAYKALYGKFLLELGMILARGTARILRASRAKVCYRARDGEVGLNEVAGFFDAAEEAAGLGMGFDDEDLLAGLVAGGQVPPIEAREAADAREEVDGHDRADFGHQAGLGGSGDILSEDGNDAHDDGSSNDGEHGRGTPDGHILAPAYVAPYFDPYEDLYEDGYGPLLL